jgi:hypothetical protein
VADAVAVTTAADTLTPALLGEIVQEYLGYVVAGTPPAAVSVIASPCPMVTVEGVTVTTPVTVTGVLAADSPSETVTV